jgi:hypothetical protein
MDDLGPGSQSRAGEYEIARFKIPRCMTLCDCEADIAAVDATQILASIPRMTTDCVEGIF